MNIDEILKLEDLHREEVAVPEWGGIKLTVVSMTGVERGELEKKWANRQASSDPVGFRADVLERTLKQDDGKPLGTAEQIKQLVGKNAQAIERLFEAGCRVSGLSKQDVRALEGN